MSDPNTSESLLTEILLHVQSLNANVEDFKITLSKISKDVKNLEKKVDDIVEHGFVDKDLNAHRIWHSNKQRKKIFGLF